MGYALHIEREEVLDPVTGDEWVDYVRSDPEMELATGGRVDAKLPDGDVLSYTSEGLAIWIGHPRHDPIGFRCLLDYRDGGIHISNPDDETIDKMRQIAERLRAKVAGDEGEQY